LPAAVSFSCSQRTGGGEAAAPIGPAAASVRTKMGHRVDDLTNGTLPLRERHRVQAAKAAPNPRH
jgi:hypothetical protein